MLVQSGGATRADVRHTVNRGPTPTSTAPRPRAPSLFRPISGALRLPTAHVQLIDDSHDRCAALGLSRIESPDFTPLSRSEFVILRERNTRLFEHAAPIMEMLAEQITHTHSMVVLCDATGTVLHAIGDDDFLERADKVALAPGANWSETSKGTNGIGTALVSEVPTLVHADEHFIHANHFLTCSAAPILDPRGNILGVLDVSGDQRSYHQHTMALVTMSARMIENHWLTDDYRHVMRLHFHSRADFIGTLKEGILAVSADGQIVGANRSALDLLGLSGAALRMHSLHSLLGVSVGRLVDHFRSPLAKPYATCFLNGQGVHLLARFDWPVWHTIAEAAVDAPVRARSDHPVLDHAVVDKARAAGAGDAAGLRGAAGASPATDRALRTVAPPLADEPPPLTLACIDTGDAAVHAILEKARRVADRDVPIVIQGELGTGKETLARALHVASRRRDEPFVTLHCASLPAASIEMELFGVDEPLGGDIHRRRQTGGIEQAHGGTLFIDDVGELPLPVQARLLRVLQDREVTPLGSHRARRVQVAIVCASRDNLRERVAARTFREDLYYHLHGFELRLPALRERSDFDELARRMVARALWSQAPSMPLDDDALGRLRVCAWPGNVHQLANAIRGAVILAQGEASIGLGHFGDEVFAAASADPVPPLESSIRDQGRAPSSVGGAEPAAGACSLDDIEVHAIRAAVQACSGNISAASKRLGISRNTIYRKLRWKDGERAP
jgi:sigma-54 dependent transcriptional regulator, acetoin dehydrogenase operon transcriptional activator AcoR